MFEEWLIYAITALVCFGLVNVLDSFYFGSGIYDNIWDGIIISSTYKILGVAIIGGSFFTEAIKLSPENALLSVVGGVLISGAYLSFFAAILHYNDTPLIQAVWTLSSPLVVLLGWLFLGEEFSTKTYFGMAIVFLGAFVIPFSKKSFKCELGKFVLLLIPMVVLYSSFEVLMKYIEEMRKVEFTQSFPFVCLGQVLFGMTILLIRKNIRHIGRIVRKNWRFFIFGEALDLTGLFMLQLAIAKASAVSLVGVVQSFMPVAVIILTGISIFFLKILKKGEILKRIYEENMLAGISTKLIITALMMFGIYFI